MSIRESVPPLPSPSSVGAAPPRPVTVIGLGQMGAALVGALLRAGHPTTVWNRSPGRAGALVAQGATHAAGVADAVAASPLTIVCVLDYDAVREVLAPLDGALAGRALVNLTNGTPRQARETAAWVTAQGAAHLDGGIMAVPSGIGTSAASLLYSGSRDAFDAHRRALEVLGAPTYLGDDPGLASLYDLALLSAMYGMFAGFLQAVALVGTEGVSAAAFSTLVVPWLGAMGAALPEMARQVDRGDYTSGVESNLRMQAAGFANLTRAGREQGVEVNLLAPIQALIERRVADGHGDEDLAGLIEQLRSPARPAGAA